MHAFTELQSVFFCHISKKSQSYILSGCMWNTPSSCVGPGTPSCVSIWITLDEIQGDCRHRSKCVLDVANRSVAPRYFASDRRRCGGEGEAGVSQGYPHPKTAWEPSPLTHVSKKLEGRRPILLCSVSDVSDRFDLDSYQRPTGEKIREGNIPWNSCMQFWEI